MHNRYQDFSPDLLDLMDAAENAIRKIAPLFPLTQPASINPFGDMSDDPIAVAATRLGRAAGAQIFPDRAIQLRRYEAGGVTLTDIHASRVGIAHDLDLTGQVILDTAKTADPTPKAIPTVADLAAEHSGTDWSNLVAERIGIWAQGHFDTTKTLGRRTPDKTHGPVGATGRAMIAHLKCSASPVFAR